MADNYEANLSRIVLAHITLLNMQTAARDMFGKGYWALGVGERTAVDQAVWTAVRGTVAWATPDGIQQFLGPEEAGLRHPVGFPIAQSSPKETT